MLSDEHIVYAQDEPDHAPFVATAELIVNTLARGETPHLKGLPVEFEVALQDRMKRRVNERASGVITESEFALEHKKMVSVACIGLREASYRGQVELI